MTSSHREYRNMASLAVPFAGFERVNRVVERISFGGVLGVHIRELCLMLPDDPHSHIASVYMTVEVPDRDTGEKTVIRTSAPMRLDTRCTDEMIIVALRHHIMNWLMHELDEGFRVDGKIYRDPHHPG